MEKLTFEIQQEIIDKAIREITARKESLLREAIMRLQAFDAEQPFDLKAEAQRRFCRLRCEIVNKNHTENWYWNDGTPEGLLLIVFTPIHGAIGEDPRVFVSQFGFTYTFKV